MSFELWVILIVVMFGAKACLTNLSKNEEAKGVGLSILKSLFK